MESNELWFLLAYIAGSISGVWLMTDTISRGASKLTIDTLIENGYIKTRIREDGEIELIKHNEENT